MEYTPTACPCRFSCSVRKSCCLALALSVPVLACMAIVHCISVSPRALLPSSRTTVRSSEDVGSRFLCSADPRYTANLPVPSGRVRQNLQRRLSRWPVRKALGKMNPGFGGQFQRILEPRVANPVRLVDKWHARFFCSPPIVIHHLFSTVENFFSVAGEPATKAMFMALSPLEHPLRHRGNLRAAVVASLSIAHQPQKERHVSFRAFRTHSLHEF